MQGGSRWAKRKVLRQEEAISRGERQVGKALCNQEDTQEALGSCSQAGNRPGVPQGPGHGFGDSGGDGAEVEEEDGHWVVEAVVAGFICKDEATAQEGSQADTQEH